MTVVVRVPPSKSQLQRALVLASLARGQTCLEVPSDGAGWPLDAMRARELVEAAGARVVVKSSPGPDSVDRVFVQGRPGGWRSGVLALGESGTLGRLATAAAALAGEPGAVFRLVPEGTLESRSSPALVAALRAAGCALTTAPDSTWPLELRRLEVPSPTAVLEDPGSSQEVTALLLALAARLGAAPGSGTLGTESELLVRGSIPSRPYVDLTIAMLARFGVDVSERSPEGDSQHARRFVVRHPPRAPSSPLAVEPDASAAAVALAAGCVGGREVRVRGLSAQSVQGDVRIVEGLRAFGCEAGFERANSEDASDCFVSARGAPRQGVDLDLSDTPDLAPVLAALALRAASAHRETSRLRGLETLPGKESSRIRVLAQGLCALGARIEHDDASLTIAPQRRVSEREGEPHETIVLDPEGDHRMAFAFALAALGRRDVHIEDSDCVAKSWPGFWDALRAFDAGGAASSA